MYDGTLPHICCLFQDLQGISLLHFFLSSCIIINLLNMRLSFLRGRCLLLFFLLYSITPVMLSNEILKYAHIFIRIYIFAYIYFSKKKNIYIISVISCHVLQKLSVRWKGQHLKRINSCLSTYLNFWLTLVSWHICSLIDSLATLTIGRSGYIILWHPSYEFVTTTWLIVWETNHLHTPIPSTTFLLVHASLIVVNSFFW